MYIDLLEQSDSTEISADICVIGGGAAGITLARALASTNTEVCLLEAGGLRLDPRTQRLYDGESVGLPYDLTETRVRYFGGSTNREGWGGWCKPLDPIDFEVRSWAPYSGWPFGRDVLEPYYRRAQEICELGPYDYDLESWRTKVDLDDLPISSERVMTQIMQLGPPTRFGKRYREDLERAQNVSVYLNANATKVMTTSDGAEATGVEAVSIKGNRLFVRSRAVVLAAGGIENARLLLVSGSPSSPGLGNEHDLVGRYFMDHPRLFIGSVEFSDEERFADLYDCDHKFQKRKKSLVNVYDETLVAGSLNLTPEFQRVEGLLNYRTWIVAKYANDKAASIDALKRLYIAASERTVPRETLAGDVKSVFGHPREVAGWTYDRLARPRNRVQSFQLINLLEPEQVPDSRITLTDRLDSLGLPRVRVDWRIGKLVRQTLARAHEVIDEDLRQSGVGRLVDPFQVDDEQRFRAALNWTWHHMGTTRMHDDPGQGVVDANTRVHGTSNLYLAGSSVFPTAGNDMPTFTIVALALRLADHLVGTLDSPPSRLSVEASE